MATTYNATIYQAYLDDDFGIFYRYYRISSPTSPPTLNTDFNVVFPALTSSQYKNNNDWCYLGFNSTGSSGRTSIIIANYDPSKENSGANCNVYATYSPRTTGETRTLQYRREYCKDTLTNSFKYYYHYVDSSLIKRPPQITGFSVDTGYQNHSYGAGNIIGTFKVNWGTEVATNKTLKITMKIVLDGYTYQYDLATKKWTNGINIAMNPTTRAGWENISGITSTTLEKTYKFNMDIGTMFGKNYYMKRTPYYQTFPDGGQLTVTATATTSMGTDVFTGTFDCPELWDCGINGQKTWNVMAMDAGLSYGMPGNYNNIYVSSKSGRNLIRRVMLFSKDS